MKINFKRLWHKVSHAEANVWLTGAIAAIFFSALAFLNLTTQLQGLYSNAAFTRTGTYTTARANLYPHSSAASSNNANQITNCTSLSDLRKPTAQIVAVTATTIKIRAINSDPASCGKSRLNFDYAFNNKAADDSYVLDRLGHRVGKKTYTAPDGSYSVDPLFSTSNLPSNYLVAPGGYIEITYNLNIAIFPLNKDFASAIFFDAIHGKPDYCYTDSFSQDNPQGELCAHDYDSDANFIGNTTARVSKAGVITASAVQNPSGNANATAGTWAAATNNTDSTGEATGNDYDFGNAGSQITTIQTQQAPLSLWQKIVSGLFKIRR